MENEKKLKLKDYLGISIFLILFTVVIGYGIYSEFFEKKDTEPSSTQTFYGYDCTSDCSGHEAGYNWAENKNITDENDCGGNSNSFEEGCKAYITGDINFGNGE